MNRIVAAELVIFAACIACGNARGATDSTVAYTSRQQVQCNTVTMAADQTVTEVIANCTNVNDLPLAGSCSNPGPGGADAMLAVSIPLSWSNSSAGRAGWACGWTTGGQGVHVPNGQATICCVVIGQ